MRCPAFWNFLSLFILSALAAYARPGSDPKAMVAPVTPPSDAGVYVGVFGGANVIQDFGDGNTVGTSKVAPTATTSVHDANTIGGVGGLKVGYNFDSYVIDGDFMLQPAIEAEAFYLGTQMKLHANINQTGLPAKFNANASGDLDEAAFFVNGLVRFKNGSIFTPYIGGGVGGLYMSMSDVNFHIHGTFPPPAPASGFNITPLSSNMSDDDFVFATQAIAGCDVVIAKNWDLFAEYKFVAAVDPEFNYSNVSTAGDNFKINPDFVTQHLFTAGIKYNF